MRRNVLRELQDPVVVDIEEPLRVLTRDQIQRLDSILAESGPFAEVWLYKRHGKLHSIKRVETTNAIRAVIR